MFKPDNPVRQMLADLILHSNSRPRAILCAEASVDTPSNRPDVHEPDDSCETVEEMLGDMYVGKECSGFLEIAPGAGKPFLYVDRRRMGGAEAETTVEQIVRSSVNTIPRMMSPPVGVAESSQSEASTVASSRVWMELPVRQGGDFL